MKLQLPKDFIVITWIPYYAKLKGEAKPPRPVAKARTSAEAVRHFVAGNYCPRGSIVQVFTPQMLQRGEKPMEHRLKEYRRSRVR